MTYWFSLTSIAATGLGTILQASSHVLLFLKTLGGIYLLWLAWCSAKSALSNETSKISTIVMAWYNKARKWIDSTVAVLFTVAGIALIKSAF